MLMLSNYSNEIGLCGVIITVVWYFLLQIGKCRSTDLHFSVANIIGSIFLLISLIYHWNLSSVIIEIVWMLISLYGVVKSLLLRRAAKQAQTFSDPLDA